MRRTKTALAAAFAAATAFAAVTAPASIAAVPTAAENPVGDCDLVKSTITAKMSVDTQRYNRFVDYSRTDAPVDHWSGGDSTYSEKLPGGTTAWIFSDSFLGPVADDGTRPESSPFVNNSIVLERKGSLKTIHGGTATAPNGIFPQPDPNHWYWMGDTYYDAKTKTLNVVALQFEKFGPGIWDWGWKSNYLGTIDTKTWKATGLVPLPSAAGVQWSAWILDAGKDRYVYGVEDKGLSKYQHVAKVIGGNLADLSSWRYWTGNAWSTKETDSVRVMDGVANEHSVTKFKDGYLLVTQDTHELFSRNIVGYVSCSPTGPFKPIGTIATMNEVGALGTYGDPNIFSYNAHEHPDLRKGNKIYVTYNVNSFDNMQLYKDASIYQPRFLTIDLKVTK